jgi:RNA polymerase sigma-70 factor (ECF subfamily)
MVTGNDRAFRALHDTFRTQVFATARRILGNRADADEATQEVFVLIAKALPHFRGECSHATWIYRIAANVCINRGKSRARRRHMEMDGNDEALNVRPLAQLAVPFDQPDKLTEAHELASWLHKAIAKLEPSFRECLVLRDMEGMTYDQIAEATGVPRATVKTRIHRARESLRQAMADGGLS